MKVFAVCYVIMGLWFASHQEAWERHCQRQFPFMAYASIVVIWPIAAGLIAHEDIWTNESFICHFQ